MAGREPSSGGKSDPGLRRGPAAPLSRNAEIQEALKALARGAERIAFGRRSVEQHAEFLAPAHEVLAAVLEREQALSLVVTSDALLFEGEAIYSEVDHSLCPRLYAGGVRAIRLARGLTAVELSQFVHIALAEPLTPTDPGREDAATELWKAELPHVAYELGPAPRPGGEEADKVLAAAHGARASLAARGAVSAELEATAARLPPVMLPDVRDLVDSEAWGEFASRGVSVIARLVESGFAGRDFASLMEVLARLVDEMVRRGEARALAQALVRVKSLPPDKRAHVAGRLAELPRLVNVGALAGPDAPGALQAWLALLPPEAGPVLLDAAEASPPAARDAFARRAAERLEACPERYVELLRNGAPELARALLRALSASPPHVAAATAAEALVNAAPAVQLDAIALVAEEPALAARELAPLLRAKASPVRTAAARALGEIGATSAVPLLLEAVQRAGFELAERPEQEAFHRALGLLKSDAGFEFFAARLARKGRFARGRFEEEQLLAIHGLAAEATPRALRELELGAADPKNPPLVVSASRSAALYVRNQLTRGGET